MIVFLITTQEVGKVQEKFRATYSMSGRLVLKRYCIDLSDYFTNLLCPTQQELQMFCMMFNVKDEKKFIYEFERALEWESI